MYDTLKAYQNHMSPLRLCVRLKDQNLLTLTMLSLQCYHVLVRYVWKITIIQKVCVGSYLVLVCCLFCSLMETPDINFSNGNFFPRLCRAFVFFSSPIPKELVSHIKKDGTVLTRISSLREVSLELLFLDKSYYRT